MRVLVTRPALQAARTARLLADRGFEPVLLALTETRALPCGRQDHSPDFDAVAVTSANGIRHAPRELVRRFCGLPCFAVGETTARSVRNAGFLAVVTGPGEAAGLAALLIENQPRALLYLCGRVRRPEFETALADAGIAVTALETYDTVALRPEPPQVSAELGDRAIDIALLYSEHAALALAALAVAPPVRALFADTRYLCLSQRIADTLANGLPQAKVASAPEPSEAALLSLVAFA